MVISRYGEITFRHFQDNPTWAAAAGYDFNYLDCLSVSAQVVASICVNTADEICSLPDYEVRDVPAFLVKISVASFMVLALIFTYPLLAAAINYRCSKSKKKYSGEHNDITSHNMRVWLRQCNNRWGRENG